MALTEPAIPAWTLGDRMRKARVAAGLEQADLAKRVGVSRPTVSQWERGRSEPRATQLLAWADATGHHIEWLLGVRSRCSFGRLHFLGLISGPVLLPIPNTGTSPRLEVVQTVGQMELALEDQTRPARPALVAVGAP